MTSSTLRAALDEGMAAFARTESSHQEIREVFISLDDTIKTATAGKVSLVVHEAQESTRPLTAGGLLGTLEYFDRALRGANELALWKVWMLQATATDGQTKHEELFRAQISQHGYPVALKFLDERVVCHDRESLESTLADLLRRPEVGGKVRQLRDAAA